MNQVQHNQKPDWDRICADWAQSGLSQTSYARRHQLSRSQLTYQIRKRRQSTSDEAGFIPVNIATPCTVQETGLSLKLRCKGFQIRFRLEW